MKLTAWILKADANKDMVIRSPIEYFNNHFVAERMGDDWSAPAIRIEGKSKRLRDFVSWMNSAPVISERALIALEPTISKHCEILPLIILRGRPFFTLNVLTLIDCLDRKGSDILYSSEDPKRILHIGSYKLEADKIPEHTAIFKIPDDLGSVFVTWSFIEAVIENGLSGASFADPSVNPFTKIARGEPLNVVPDLPE